MTRRAAMSLVLGLALVLLLADGSMAHAAPISPAAPQVTPSSSVGVPVIGPDCKGDPPLPASPVGILGLRPAVTSTADPFTTPGVSIASVYGTNYRWWWYDNGCGAGSDIMPALTTNIANVIGQQIPGLLLAIGQGLFTAVIDPSSWIGFLDKPIEQATASVAAGVWFPFLSLTLLVVAVVTLLRAAHGRLSGTITATVWALTVLVLVTWTVGYPTESVKMLDSGIQTAVITTAQGFSPQAQQVGPQASSNTPTEASARAQAVAAMDAQWDTINRSTVYRSWLAGVFGNADSPTATKFGPTVFRATHFTWAEYDTYQRDPTGAGKPIVDRKAGEFRRVAEQMSSADPVAYQFFTGNRTGDRLGTAVLCLFITLIVTVFFITAGLLTVLGYAVARLIVPATPAAGVFFLLDSFRELALSWGQRIVKFLVMGPIAFLASLVLFAFTSAIFTATMPDGLKYLFITALSWLAWRLMRPHTAMGRIHMPGKKLLGQVLAMKLLLPDRHRTGSTGGSGSGSGAGADEVDDEVAPQPRQPPRAPGGDRPVYTRTRSATASPPVDQDSQDMAEHEPVVYSTAPAPAARDPRRPLGTTAPPPAHRRLTPGPLDVGNERGEVGLYHPAAYPALAEEQPSGAPSRRVVPIQYVAQEQTSSRPTGALPNGQDKPPAALPPGPGPIEGQLWPPEQPLPTRVHEANLTYDHDGNRVFQVYRPQGSRFHAQDE